MISTAWDSKECPTSRQSVAIMFVAVGKPDEKIVLTEAAPGDSVDYYRDDEDVHYVPKRRLQDVVLSRKA